MRLAIDLDGVLAVFERNFVQVLREVGCQVEFPLDSPDFPDVWDWPQKWGATPAEVEAAWDIVKQSPRFWYLAQPRPTTHADLSALRLAETHGHDLYFVTNRPGTSAKRQTEDWLIARGWGSCPTVLITGIGAKHLVTRALEIDAYIDDMPENLEGHTRRTQLFLFDKPYNRESSLYTRVTTVSQMLQQLGLL